MKLSCEAEEHCRRELGNIVGSFFFFCYNNNGEKGGCKLDTGIMP